MTLNFDTYLPEGEHLYDYQHVGVAYALMATRAGQGCFICDEQGLGKTRQSIVVAKAKGCKKILCIVKASLKFNWFNEIQRCAPEWTCQVLAGTLPYETTAQCVIINYDLLSTWAEALLEEEFDCMILDESHYCKDRGTPKKPVQRTVAALQIAADVRSRQGTVLCLTGTPLLNRPVELVTQLQIMGRLQEISPKPRGGRTDDRSWEYAFKNTFCDPQNNGWGTTYNGSSQPEVLNRKMREHGLVRRMRAEVLDLSDTHRITTPLSLNGGLDEYHRIEDTFVAKNQNSYYIELLTALRQAAGLAKIPAAVDWLKTFKEENPNKKVVVWAWHIPVQRNIAAACNKAGIKAIYLGSAKGQAIEDAKKAFNEGDVDVLVCSLQAHAFGHTLVGDGWNVTDSLFVEMPWHPGTVSQAEDRINRIGRKADAVFATTLVVEDTVDGWLAHLIAEKWSTFKAAVDGTIPEGEELDIKNALIGMLMKKFPKPRGEDSK